MCFASEEFNGTHKTRVAVSPKTEKVEVKCVACDESNQHEVDFSQHPEVTGDERIRALEDLLKPLLVAGIIGQPDEAWFNEPAAA